MHHARNIIVGKFSVINKCTVQIIFSDFHMAQLGSEERDNGI